jgi:ABC-type branched-subunit amino acid transport system ATPase component
MNATGLRATGVVMSFGGVDALKQVTVDAAPAQWLGLIGPNGSGKTTLLNVLSGLYAPRAGTVELNGTDITHARPANRARLGVVRTFQHPQLAGSLTVLENVLVGSRLAAARHGRRRPDAERARALLESFGCGQWADVLPDEAPYGVRKIAEVVRAAAAEPRVLLLDEPAAGLNQEERDELISSLLTFRTAEPDTIVCLVEHDVPLVTRLCLALAVLNAGAVIATGDAAEVLALPAVREAYLGQSASEGSTSRA